MEGRRQGGSPGAAAYPDEHSLVDTRGVHDCDGVRSELGVGVAAGRLRPVGPAVPARVDGDHPESPGQARHLGLPDPGVNEYVRGGEYHCWLALAEHLIAVPSLPGRRL